MTPAGWIFMGASWTFILALFGYCLYRTLKAKDNSTATKTQRHEE